MNKKNVRIRLQRKRNDLSNDLKHAKNKKIMEKLENWPLFKRTKTILFYISKNNEVDTHALIQKYLPSKTIVVPVSKPATKNLELCVLKNWNDLKKGPFQILEPKTRRKPFQKNRIDLAIIPGIAFDRKGSRIGHGEGYFDKLLAHIKAPKMALAYHFQIVKNIRSQEHDIPMDFIITEREIINCQTRSVRGVYSL